jgi:peroxiredoxin Q/BCP
MKLTRILFAMAFSFLGFGASADPLEIGADAPAITALDQDGNTVDFGDLYKKGIVLVYFYPKADTSGCSAQACSLRDDYEVLAEKNVTVVGVSTDNEKAQKAFQEKYNLPFTLIPDHEKKVVNAFGVPIMGAGLTGLASRQAYLVKGGKIVWRDLKASTKEQADDVVAALKTLGD